MTPEELKELCRITCDCGYCRPRPDWPHPEWCGYVKALSDLQEDNLPVVDPT